VADRTSAALFGAFFARLSKNPDERNRELATWLLEQSRSYDFSECQMDADDDLIALGLARRGIDPDYPDEGETVLYGPEAKP
jgi:hypothetical protein